MQKVKISSQAQKFNHLTAMTDTDALFLQRQVPIDHYMEQILEVLPPRTTQRLLMYYVKKLDQLI